MQFAAVCFLGNYSTAAKIIYRVPNPITRPPSIQKTACFSIPVIPILLLCKLHIVNCDLRDIVRIGKTVEECGKTMI